MTIRPIISGPRSTANCRPLNDALRGRPVLFLDFDGVLSKGLSGGLQHLGLFCEWLVDNPSFLVVVTSDWRSGTTPATLATVFDSRCSDRLVDFTPMDLRYEFPDDFSYVREREILEWRARTGHAGPFVALDDQSKLFSPHCPWLVLTDHQRGVTPEDLRKAETLIQLAGSSESQRGDARRG